MSDADERSADRRDDGDESGTNAAYDVAIVGGGPSGCSAGLFTARYGLETVVFDRGSSSLRRCAYLENYLGFPGGVDIETFYDLMHDHAERAGCEIVPDLVEAVTRDEGDTGFVLETQDGRDVAAECVIAASRYDGEYLRPLGSDEMFETHDHGGEEHEHFDPDYADSDGRTPIEGLYVAAPAGERSAQAIAAAGQGSHVARSVLEDRRAERGYPDGVAKHYDWLRPDTEFDGEWGERDRWREWFDDRIDAESADDEDLEEIRETYIDRAFRTRVSDDEIETRAERGAHRLLEHVDDEHIRSYLDRKDADDGSDSA